MAVQRTADAIQGRRNLADAALWAGLKELEGATVETMRGKPFTVLVVNPGKQGAIVIEIASTGKRRTIRRDEIERAYSLETVSKLAGG